MTLPKIRKKQAFRKKYEEFHLHPGQIRKLTEHPRECETGQDTILNAVQRLNGEKEKDLDSFTLTHMGIKLFIAFSITRVQEILKLVLFYKFTIKCF